MVSATRILDDKLSNNVATLHGESNSYGPFPRFPPQIDRSTNRDVKRRRRHRSCSHIINEPSVSDRQHIERGQSILVV